MDEQLAKIDTGWFNSFYGKPFNPNIKVNLSLTNGPHNYAFDGGILIGIYGDNDVNPIYTIYTEYTILHEINHHYAHSFFTDSWPQM